MAVDANSPIEAKQRVPRNVQCLRRSLSDPFRDYTLHFAESKITLKVADLLSAAGPPR